MNSTVPGQSVPDHDIDEELVITFLTEFHAFEQALVRAGYTKAGLPSRNPRPDWVRFARHIERHFRPDSSPELEGAVSYLLCEPDKLQLRNERQEHSYPGETSSPYSDLVWLSELVQEMGNRLSHEVNFLKRPACDTAYMTAALLVLEAFSYIDPTVESLLTRVQ